MGIKLVTFQEYITHGGGFMIHLLFWDINMLDSNIMFVSASESIAQRDV